jgi:beta-lactamase regulating signal transducer with metallopeptidase domain
MTVDLVRLADVILKVSVVMGAAALATRALARRSAAARHLVWTFAIGTALAMPILTNVVPRWTVAVLPASGLSEPAAADAVASPANNPLSAGPTFPPSRSFGGPAVALAEAGKSGASEASARQEKSEQSTRAAFAWPNLTPQMALVAIWLAGATLVLLPLAFGTVRMWWIAHRSKPASEAAWAPLAWRLAASLQLDGRVAFLSGRREAMPMAWGLWRPRVMLPAEADEWPMARQRVVLLHELAHVRRRDCLTQLLAQLACAAYWFNPLVWLAARRLRAERERACDDLVLAAGTRGSDYADHLLEIARSLRAAAPTWSAVAMAHRSQLEGRLMAILDPALPRRSPTRTAAVVCATLAVAGVLPLAALQPVAKAEAAVTSALPADAPPSLEARVEEPARPQGRPSSPARPTPTPTPSPTPTPTPSPGPSPSPSPDVEVEAEYVAEAVGGVVGGVVGGIAGGIGQGAGQGSGSGKGKGERDRNGDADPKVVAALTAALNDENKDVREQALHALSQMRAPIAAEIFVKLLKDEDADVRQQAVFALGQTRDAKHVDALVGALKDPIADVREQAAFALGQLRDKRAVDPLLGVLKDADADVREQAAFALGQLRDPRAIDGLIAALKDADADVRQQAAFALGQIR